MPEQNYITVCSQCGHKTAAYLHILSKVHIKLIRLTVEFYQRHARPMQLKDIEKDLTKTEYLKYTILQHFGLTEHVSELDAWLPTSKAYTFLSGKEAIADRVLVFGNRALLVSHPAWGCRSKKPRSVFIAEVGYTPYKQRRNYQQEKAARPLRGVAMGQLSFDNF